VDPTLKIFTSKFVGCTVASLILEPELELDPNFFMSDPV
jgi:hypothetical protein